MPPVSTTARTTSLRKRRPHGKPPSAGTTSTQSSGSPKFERSEQRQRIERPHQMPVQCALAGASPTVVRPLISHGVGRVTLRPPVPTHSEGDGLASDLTDAQSLSGGDSERFTATRPPAQSS